MAYELEDRVVFITGGSSGIGRACVLAFHQAGSRVVAVARSEEKLAELQARIDSDRVLTIAADLIDAGQRQSALDRARAHFGPVDVLVNNAGWAAFAPLVRTTAEHVSRMLDLNFSTPLALIQAVLPEMAARGSGQIINVSSVIGFQPMPRMAVYCASKAALNALSTSLRMELRGTGIDVILVAPASTRTAFFETAAQIGTQAVRHASRQHSPEWVAEQIVRASRKRKREVILGGGGKAITWIRRLSPRLADRIMLAVAKKAMPECPIAKS